MDKIRLALNRANSKVKLDIGEVERTLGLKAESFIPSDIAIPRSVNKGVPVVIDAPKGEVTDAFEELANLYTGSTPSATAKKSRFF
jgi:pilus assembly protein CpaE